MKMDTLSLIMDYEAGELSDAKTLELFSELIKTGQVWTLQGHYGRMAHALIEAKFVDRKGTILKHL